MVNSGIFYWIADLPVEHSNKWRERVKTQAVRNEFSILLLMATEMLPTVINDRKTDLRFFFSPTRFKTFSVDSTQ